LRGYSLVAGVLISGEENLYWEPFPLERKTESPGGTVQKGDSSSRNEEQEFYQLPKVVLDPKYTIREKTTPFCRGYAGEGGGRRL